ncbi:hypothetical protein HKX48_009036 [Thoreauomyces humboldtii]|nr:hypothetical protein HKX48_009036 [Thoreauomyces humboldtii]
MDLLPHIFFEKQEGQLCAQHSLNALLQGPYFSPIDLADLARQLDESERLARMEGGETAEYAKWLSEGSANYDDSGFFSVQVIEKALEVWGLGVKRFAGEDGRGARDDPTGEEAFICNLSEHWFTLRRFGASSKRWYNLNSVFDRPAYVSETYLALLLAQLQNEGYSIFVLTGKLPQSEADVYAEASPVPDPSQIPKGPAGKASGMEGSLSVKGVGQSGSSSGGGDDELARAIAMSLGQPTTSSSTPSQAQTPTSPTLQRALAESLKEGSGGDNKSLQEALRASMAEDDERAVQAALAASLGDEGTKRGREPETNATGPGGQPTMEEMTPEEIRRRRLERFGGS